MELTQADYQHLIDFAFAIYITVCGCLGYVAGSIR
jgi:hypothetical protein